MSKLAGDRPKKVIGRADVVKEKKDSDFLSAFAPSWREWVKLPPPRYKWLIEGWIPHQAITILSGHQKRATKSLLAYQLATIIAEGIRSDYFTCYQQGKVLYIQGEMPHGITHERVWATSRGLGLKEPSEHVHFNYLQGTKLDDLHSLHKLKRMLKLLKPELVVLDTFFYLHDSDENSPTELKPIVDVVQEWQREYGCAILLITHLNKARGEDPEAPLSAQIRGSNVLPGVMDFHIAVRKYKDDDSPPLVFFETRGIHQEPGKLLWAFDNRIRDVGDGLVERYGHSFVLRFMTEKMEQEEREAEARGYIEMLEHGCSYGIADLEEEWGLDRNDARGIAQRAKKLSLLTVVKGEYKRRKSSKKDNRSDAEPSRLNTRTST